MLVAPDWSESKGSCVVHPYDPVVDNPKRSENVKIIRPIPCAGPLLVFPLPRRIETKSNALFIGVTADQGRLQKVLPHLIRNHLADLKRRLVFLLSELAENMRMFTRM